MSYSPDHQGDRVLVYLAGPVDYVTKDAARGWREQACRILRSMGFGAFSPAHAFDVAGVNIESAGPAIRAINRVAIYNSVGVLAVINGTAFETIREIEYARSLGKPVALVSDHPARFGGYDLEWFHAEPTDSAISAAITWLLSYHERTGQ